MTDHTSSKPLCIIKEMNKEFAVLVHGSKVVILQERSNNNEVQISYLNEKGFSLLQRNKPKIPVGNDTYISKDKYWLNHSRRREYKGLFFHPKDAKKDYFNLYTGFAVEPCQGDVMPFLKFCKEVICSNNDEYFQYLKAWVAQLLQEPENKIGVAIIIQGLKGVGKSMFAACVGSLLGQHYAEISNGYHLVGNFNSHLSKLLLLCVDEALWVNDKKAEGVLKNMITAPTSMYESKGVDAIPVDNFMRIIMTTNNDFAVPASGDERRYFIIKCADTYKGNHQYFHKLQEYMDNGGREALLEYFLNYIRPKSIELRNPPHTEGLDEQKIHSLTPIAQWWLESLINGELYGEGGYILSDTGFTVVSRKECLSSCLSFMRDMGMKRFVTSSILGKYLNKVVSNLTDIGSSNRKYQLPYLRTLRKDFENEIGPYDW